MDRPPALLLTPSTDGAWDVGSRGVRVLTREPRRLHPLRRWEPLEPIDLPVTGPGAFPPLERLQAVAAAHPGAVLLPTSDGVAFWSSFYRDELNGLRLGLPPHEAVHGLLNKRLLYETAGRLGIPVPQTAVLRNRQAVTDVPFPLVVKPQGRVGGSHWLRALVVKTPADLPGALRTFDALVRFSPEMVAADPEVGLPLLQEYHAVAPGRLYHLAGFVAPNGNWAMRGKRTLLQYPLRVGNGLCFEPAEEVPEVRERVLRLCRETGYFGVFEAEFLEVDGEYLLTDFNPRFFNGMTQDIARGLPLPWMAYLAGLGEWETLDAELDRAREERGRDDATYCLAPYFWLMVAMQGLTGGMGLREVRRWAGWYRANRSRHVDPFSRPDSPYSAWGLALRTGVEMVRDPRFFWGTFLKRG